MMRDSMYQWACDLFPIHRSITGEELRETLGYIKNILPELEIMAINSGEKVYDWEVPQEWSIHDAWIEDEFGDRVLEYCDNNLHVVSYSEPIDEIISLDELQKHLYSLESQPDAIPYVTSYYKKVWGFCIEHKKRLNLHDGKYHVYINSKKFDGALNYGELIIKGSSKEEILLSTYVCHPSMANNELSGPVVAIALALWLKKIETRYTYRIVFTPETIGSICYINRNIETLKKNVVAGYVLTCLGDNNEYSYMPSRTGATLSDKVAKHVLKYYAGDYKRYSFLERGSDERQYCSPLVDLPVCSITRTMYTKYHQYHTSLDNLDFISQEGLNGGYQALQHCINILEMNHHWKATVFCEPQLGKRGLYSNVSLNNGKFECSKPLAIDILAYADGINDLVDIAEYLKKPAWELIETIKKLEKYRLIESNI